MRHLVKLPMLALNWLPTEGASEVTPQLEGSFDMEESLVGTDDGMSRRLALASHRSRSFKAKLEAMAPNWTKKNVPEIWPRNQRSHQETIGRTGNAEQCPRARESESRASPSSLMSREESSLRSEAEAAMKELTLDREELEQRLEEASFTSQGYGVPSDPFEKP